MSVPIVVELLLRLMVRRGIRPAEVTASCHGQTSAKPRSGHGRATAKPIVHHNTRARSKQAAVLALLCARGTVIHHAFAHEIDIGGSLRDRRAASASTLRTAFSKASRSRVMSCSLSAGSTPAQLLQQGLAGAVVQAAARVAAARYGPQARRLRRSADQQRGRARHPP
jgi:hypothetical protein